jgi:hypothetical protein
MAKCSVCNSRKGKRQCVANSTFICSLCCGQSRTQDKCTGCSFYKDVSSNRNYRKVPFFEIQEMSNSAELQDISNVVESVFVAFDLESEEFIDKTAEKLLELAFDKYHFHDSVLPFSNVEQRDWFERMSRAIEQDLSNTTEELLTKVLASIYRSIQRRTGGGREYLQFTKQYVGARIGSGARIINL